MAVLNSASQDTGKVQGFALGTTHISRSFPSRTFATNTFLSHLSFLHKKESQKNLSGINTMWINYLKECVEIVTHSVCSQTP